MNAETLNDAAPEGAVLHVRVGAGSLADAAARFTRAAKAAQEGAAFTPRIEVSFERMGQMLAVFTPKRWELVAALRAGGPSSVRALAQRLGRDYKNVHGDVAALEQFMAVQRMADGRVCVPWGEIVLDMLLPTTLPAAA